jgi:hypothetical protein
MLLTLFYLFFSKPWQPGAPWFDDEHCCALFRKLIFRAPGWLTGCRQVNGEICSRMFFSLLCHYQQGRYYEAIQN